MRAVAAIVVVGGAILGCADPEPIDTPHATLDSLDTVWTEGTLFMAIVHGTEFVNVPVEQVVTDVAANVALRWEPAGCAIATQDGTHLMITFDDCAGARGLAHVTGTWSVNTGITDGIADFGVLSSSTSVNGMTLDVRGAGHSGISPEGYYLGGELGGPAVGPRGNEVELRQGDYTITWDRSSECGWFYGQWQSDMPSMGDTLTYFFTRADLMSCPASCPIGTVSREFKNGATVTVTLDGTALAHWDSTAGREGTVELDCR